MPTDAKILNREILLPLWKIHILHHADEGPLVGQWMLQELREHGYDVSPGTLYPMLKRMEGHGWLRSTTPKGGGVHAPRSYRLTAEGRKVLAIVRKQLAELQGEIAPAS
jgi:DNA-binding PadR family transcriptional regulator